MPQSLLIWKPQPPTVEIDCRMPNLAHIGRRQPLSQLVARTVEHHAAQPLADFLRRRRRRIEKPDGTPYIVGLAGCVQNPPPAVKLDHLRDR